MVICHGCDLYMYYIMYALTGKGVLLLHHFCHIQLLAFHNENIIVTNFLSDFLKTEVNTPNGRDKTF